MQFEQMLLLSLERWTGHLPDQESCEDRNCIWFKITTSKLIILLFDKVSLVAQRLKHLSAMRETWVRSLGWEDPLEKEMATHSSILDWRIPWMEEPSGLQSIGSQQRIGHDWLTSLSTRIVYFSLQATSVSVWLKLVHLIPRWFTQTGSVCQLGVIMTQSSSMGVPRFGYLGFLRAWWLIPPHTVPLLLCSLAQSSHRPCLPGQGEEEGVD